ncbi:MAG TPA: potassium channel protein [Fusobacteriaceae bacterium]|nr:potassium channel protein [Fusobacteriaceae bacterium]
MKSELKKILMPGIILFLIFFLGVIGYIFIENYNLIDAFYMTSITLSTVGFGEVQKLSPNGKIFTSILIFSGITVVVYTLGNLTKFFIEGELKSYIRWRNMDKKITKLKDHYIVCGAGRTGRKIINDFLKKDLDFVVIEKDEKKIEKLMDIYMKKLLYVVGDATKDETLLQANIKNAKVLISVLPTDADNLFLTLTTKDLNQKIQVITRAVDASSEKKLRRGGADFIISPFEIAAERMVATATQTNLISFVDVFSKKSKIEGLTFEIVEIKKGSELENVTLMEAKIPTKTNLIVIGHEIDGIMKINPMSYELLKENEKLLVLGTKEQIKKLIKIASN